MSGTKLLLAGMLAALLLMLTSVGLYNLVIIKGAREGWPVIGSLVRFVVRDEFAQRDQFLRENLDVMARKVGELQAADRACDSFGDFQNAQATQQVSVQAPAPPRPV